MALVPAHVRALMRHQDGRTPLMIAAEKGSAACVAAILDVDGIDVHVQDKVCHVSTTTRATHPRTVHARPAGCRAHASSRCCLQSVLAELS